MTAWHALYAPGGTPRRVVGELVAALQAALGDPRVAERLAELGTEPVARERATPAALGRHLHAEVAERKPVIRAAGAYAE